MNWQEYKRAIEGKQKQIRETLAKSSELLKREELTDEDTAAVKNLQAFVDKLQEGIDLLTAQADAERAVTEDEVEEEVEETTDEEEVRSAPARRSNPLKASTFAVHTSKKSGSARDAAFGKYIRGQRLSEREERALETRALTHAGADLGAELVPEGVFQNYYSVLGEQSVIRQLAVDVSIVQNTRDTPYPIYDDTANEAVIIGEHSTPAGSFDPDTDELVLGGVIYAAIFTLGRKFIRNAAGNFENEVSKMGAQRIAVKQDKTHTAKMIAGATVPSGLQLVTPVLTHDILINFCDSMKASLSSGMVMMGNRKTKNVIKKLKNSHGDNIWTSAVGRNPGDPWGYYVDGVPFIENPYLPDFAADTVGSLLLVQPSCYKIQELAGAELLVNPYTNSLKYSIEYGWYHESDGGVLDGNGFLAIGVDEA